MDSSLQKKDSQHCPNPENSSSNPGDEPKKASSSPLLPHSPSATLGKAPGWRLSTSSMIKLKQSRPHSNEDSLGLTSMIGSETSISSNGPLRSWFANDEKEQQQQKQLTPAMAKISAELAQQYKYGCFATPEKSDKLFGKEGAAEGAVRRSQPCPVDPITGGYIGNLDLQQYKLILYEDNSEEEEGFASGTGSGVEKSHRSAKEKSTFCKQAVVKTPKSAYKTLTSPDASKKSSDLSPM